MKRIKKLITFSLATFVCLCGAFVVTGCTSSQAYTPPAPNPKISTPDLGEDGVLRVGVNTDKSPLAAKSTSGNIVGIDVDVAAALADELGLKLEIVDVTSDPAAAISEGRVDIVTGFDSTETVKGVLFSDVYLPTAVALFALEGTNDVPTAGSKNIKISAQVSKKSAWAVTNEFDQGVLVVCDQPKDVFNELKDGNVQYAASDAVVGSYTSRSLGIKTHIVALMQQPSGYSIGISESKGNLQTKINEALDSLNSNGVVSVIQKKWLGMTFDFSDTMPRTEGATMTEDSKKNAEEGNPADEAAGESNDAAETIAAITGGENGNQADNTEGGATEGTREAGAASTSGVNSTGTGESATATNQ